MVGGREAEVVRENIDGDGRRRIVVRCRTAATADLFFL